MKKLIALIILILPFTSHALVEVRATYTGMVAKDALSAACSGVSGCDGLTPGMVPLYGLGGDAIVKLPLVPVGFGLRYENLSLSTSLNSVSADASMKRTAAIINYRFIDTIVHFGVIGTYGLSHTGSLEVKSSGTSEVNYSGGSFNSYSIGLELEVKPLIVFPLIVGAEVGLITAKWNDAKDSVNNTTKDLNLSGNYAKAFIGLDF